MLTFEVVIDHLLDIAHDVERPCFLEVLGRSRGAGVTCDGTYSAAGRVTVTAIVLCSIVSACERASLLIR